MYKPYKFISTFALELFYKIIVESYIYNFIMSCDVINIADNITANQVVNNLYNYSNILTIALTVTCVQCEFSKCFWAPFQEEIAP